MLKFYDINKDYIKFLKTIDSQVPNIEYSTNNKFVCGIVLDIDGINYYAPISHKTQKQQTSLTIYDKEKPISTIRFSFMIPAYDEVLYNKDFSTISKTNVNYANLLKTEYTYCKMHLDDIYKKAKSVYAIGCNKNHRLNYTCCNFKELEKHYIEFKNR